MNDHPPNRPPIRRKAGAASMQELRRRLQRLGMTTADRIPAPQARTHKTGKPIEALIDGDEVITAEGPAFVVRRVYPADHVHGDQRLGAWIGQFAETMAHVADDRALNHADPARLVFLDTETTGLGPGTGTLVFQVGAGFFREDGAFEVRQYFLRDPAEERAMLGMLNEQFADADGLVTFNGRSFDVPLLTDRYILSRMPPTLQSLPNFDLLMPARRLWRRRLPSCALSALEVDVLGLKRSGQDVSGSLIPWLYREYLRTGDGGDMVRVLYHNEQDILSMVTLATVLCRVFEEPSGDTLHIDDRLSLARWYARQELAEACEIAYRSAMDEAPDVVTRYDALHGLAMLLKRQERRDETIPLWEYVADLKLDVVGHEELAKYYEWHARDLDTALTWTETGIGVAESWRLGLRRTEALRDLNHRRARLLRKLGGE